MASTGSLEHVYFFIDKPTTPSSSSNPDACEGNEVANANTPTDSTQDFDSHSKQTTPKPDSMINPPKSSDKQPDPIKDGRAYLEEHHPNFIKWYGTEKSAFFKRLQEDIAVVWSDNSLKDPARVEASAANWAVAAIGMLCYLIFGIIFTLWRTDWSFQGLLETGYILLQFFILFLQFIIWFITREGLKLDRNQNPSFWAVRSLPMGTGRGGC